MLSILASAENHSDLTQPITWFPSSMVPQASGRPTLCHTPDNSPHIVVSSLALGDGQRHHGRKKASGVGRLTPTASWPACSTSESRSSEEPQVGAKE